MGDNSSEDKRKGLFREADTDHSGAIDFMEFVHVSGWVAWSRGTHLCSCLAHPQTERGGARGAREDAGPVPVNRRDQLRGDGHTEDTAPGPAAAVRLRVLLIRLFLLYKN